MPIIQLRANAIIYPKQMKICWHYKLCKLISEHEDGRRGGEVARNVLWNSEFLEPRLLFIVRTYKKLALKHSLNFFPKQRPPFIIWLSLIIFMFFVLVLMTFYVNTSHYIEYNKSLSSFSFSFL